MREFDLYKPLVTLNPQKGTSYIKRVDTEKQIVYAHSGYDSSLVQDLAIKKQCDENGFLLDFSYSVANRSRVQAAANKQSASYKSLTLPRSEWEAKVRECEDAENEKVD